MTNSKKPNDLSIFSGLYQAFQCDTEGMTFWYLKQLVFFFLKIEESWLILKVFSYTEVYYL